MICSNKDSNNKNELKDDNDNDDLLENELNEI